MESLYQTRPGRGELYELAELFRVFGDDTRIRILYSLLDGEKCVQDISQELEKSQSAVSHQLHTLRARSLVKYRRDGRTIFYSLSDEHVFAIINQGIAHIKE